MSRVARTSIDSYHAHKGNNFAGQRQEILNAMQPGRIYSRRQVAKRCRMETSTAAARFNELIATGQVEIVGKVKCPLTGVRVEAVKRVTEQMEIAA